MKRGIFTIITKSHLPYAYVLEKSLRQFSSIDFTFYCLVVDASIENDSKSSINFLSLDIIGKNEQCAQVIEKYQSLLMDQLRWSLKPATADYLISQEYEEVLYCDADLFFVSDYDFLWHQLSGANFLLSPHWRCTDPNVNSFVFQRQFMDGVYNGGFFGVTKKGTSLLQYWTRCCCYKCEFDFASGLYVDQKYLDPLPAISSEVSIIRNKGCNIGDWNFINLIDSKNGELLIEGEFSPVFYHINRNFIYVVNRAQEHVLRSTLSDYLSQLDQHGFDISKLIDSNEVNSKQEQFSAKMRRKIRNILCKIHGR